MSKSNQSFLQKTMIEKGLGDHFLLKLIIFKALCFLELVPIFDLAALCQFTKYNIFL